MTFLIALKKPQNGVFFTIVSKYTSNVLRFILKYIQGVPKGNKF